MWGVVYAEPALSGMLTFAVLNVGQGDALYKSPTGVQLLVDGGPDDSLLRELPVVMPALDRSVDVVIRHIRMLTISAVSPVAGPLRSGGVYIARYLQRHCYRKTLETK